MIVAFCMLLLLGNDAFVVDASKQVSYNVDISRDSLRLFIDDIGLFARNMPGVVGVTPLGNNTFLYRTEKEIPFSGRMETTFLIEKVVEGDSVTVYRSKDEQDENYMSCRVSVHPADTCRTSIGISLRIRLSRHRGSEIHWLAPILGEHFIESRMNDDLEDMLKEFVERSNAELYSRFHTPSTAR